MMQSFSDELTKIAASRCSAAHPKARSGRRSIRAHNLLKKAAPILAPGVAQQLMKWKMLKYPAIAGLGAYGFHSGSKALDAYRIGKMIQEQQARRGG